MIFMIGFRSLDAIKRMDKEGMDKKWTHALHILAGMQMEQSFVAPWLKSINDPIPMLKMKTEKKEQNYIN